ncbi:PRD domain-containing protein [Lachnospiraceae bacterium 54-53]
MTHLRFFAQRIVKKRELEQEDNGGFLLAGVRESCQKELKCAQQIKKYREKNFSYVISDNELVYLAVHIHRVVSR